MKSLKIKFSQWVPWNERSTLSDSDKPGIYMMAHFDKEPARGLVDRTDPAICYIGKTWGQKGLLGRLNRFNSSAGTGKKAHHGGQNYYKKFHCVQNDLYVAVCSVPTNKDEAVWKTFIMYAERKLLWEYTQSHDKLPQCNLV